MRRLRSKQDLADLGFTWQCRKLGSQNFLLPHRRNRAWGICTRLCEADTSADYGHRCEDFFTDLSSHVRKDCGRRAFPNKVSMQSLKLA